MGKPEQLPPALNYPLPKPLDAEYIYVARAGFVKGNGNWWTADDIFVDGPKLEHIQEKLDAIKEPETSPLSWVKFYQRAVVRVCHPDRFENDTPGPSTFFSEGKPERVERVYGELFPAASPQLVTGASKLGFTFATVSEILEQGSVTKFTESWLRRYSVENNTRGFNKFLIPLLPILPAKLSRAIRENKFHDFDFED